MLATIIIMSMVNQFEQQQEYMDYSPTTIINIAKKEQQADTVFEF